VSGALFVIVNGPPGSGKSTLARLVEVDHLCQFIQRMRVT